MSEKAVFLVRPSFFKRSQLLTITPEYISLGNADNATNEMSILKEEIEAYRFAARRVRYYLYLYTYYKIEVRNLSGKIIKIRLFSLFGINKKRSSDAYSNILGALYENFFIANTRYYLDLFANEIDFKISGLIFTQQGLKFSGKNEIILWDDIGTKDYISYYAVFSKKNNYNYRGFNYWDDWNTLLIYTTTRAILNHKNLLAQ